MPNVPWTTAYLGCGANLGDRLATLRRARALLTADSRLRLVAVSPLYSGPAQGGPAGQPDYFNAVLQVTTQLSPLELLRHGLTVETACGRVRQERWGARTLDLDLLLYADLVLATEELILPHPRLHARDFVLFPLTRLAPELRHPLLQLRIDELAKRLGHTALQLVSEVW